MRSDWCGGFCPVWMEVVDKADDDGWVKYGGPAYECCSSESWSA